MKDIEDAIKNTTTTTTLTKKTTAKEHINTDDTTGPTAGLIASNGGDGGRITTINNKATTPDTPNGKMDTKTSTTTPKENMTHYLEKKTTDQGAIPTMTADTEEDTTTDKVLYKATTVEQLVVDPLSEGITTRNKKKNATTLDTPNKYNTEESKASAPEDTNHPPEEKEMTKHITMTDRHKTINMMDQGTTITPLTSNKDPSLPTDGHPTTLPPVHVEVCRVVRVHSNNTNTILNEKPYNSVSSFSTETNLMEAEPPNKKMTDLYFETATMEDAAKDAPETVPIITTTDYHTTNPPTPHPTTMTTTAAAEKPKNEMVETNLKEAEAPNKMTTNPYFETATMEDAVKEASETAPTITTTDYLMINPPTPHPTTMTTTAAAEKPKKKMVVPSNKIYTTPNKKRKAKTSNTPNNNTTTDHMTSTTASTDPEDMNHPEKMTMTDLPKTTTDQDMIDTPPTTMDPLPSTDGQVLPPFHVNNVHATTRPTLTSEEEKEYKKMTSPDQPDHTSTRTSMDQQNGNIFDKNSKKNITTDNPKKPTINDLPTEQGMTTTTKIPNWRTKITLTMMKDDTVMMNATITLTTKLTTTTGLNKRNDTTESSKHRKTTTKNSLKTTKITVTAIDSTPKKTTSRSVVRSPPTTTNPSNRENNNCVNNPPTTQIPQMNFNPTNSDSGARNNNQGVPPYVADTSKLEKYLAQRTQQKRAER